MKRLLILTVLASATALVVTSIGYAVPLANRGNPEAVTSTVTPKRDRTRPYTFRTRGTVTLPPRYCSSPNTIPGPSRSATNCIPIVCPPGAVNASYCTRPTRAQVCTGRLRVRFYRGVRTFSNKSAFLRPDCTYAQSKTMEKRATRGRLNVRVTFLGNAYLKTKAASVKNVRAG